MIPFPVNCLYGGNTPLPLARCLHLGCSFRPSQDQRHASAQPMTVYGFTRVLARAAAASALDRLRVDPVAELAPPARERHLGHDAALAKPTGKLSHQPRHDPFVVAFGSLGRDEPRHPPDHSPVRSHRRPAERVRYPVPALQLFVRRALCLDRGVPPLRVVRRHPRRHRPCLRALQPRQHLERDLQVRWLRFRGHFGVR